MAVEIISDVVTGARLSVTKQGTTETVRVFHVKGLTGDGYERVVAAVGEGIPQIDDVHPADENLYVTKQDAEAISDSTVEVRITYTTPGSFGGGPVGEAKGCTITVGTTLTSEETNVDADGNPLEVNYTIAGTGTHGGIYYPQKSQNKTTNKLVPHTTLEFRRTVATSPAAESMAYVGKLNSDTFCGTAEPRWMCTSITGTSNNGGLTYERTDTFAYDGSAGAGWVSQLLWIDPDTGFAPHDIDFTTHNGVQSFNLYNQVSFSGLSLPGT
jgi:hypothetical protein